MDRNYAEFELINEELHNLSTAAYFTKACNYNTPFPTIPYLPYHTSPKPVSILPESPTILYTILIVSTHSSLPYPTLHYQSL